MMILYPLLRKYPDVMIHIVLPLMTVLLLGWLYCNGNLQTKPTEWVTFTYKGNLRAFAELSIGVISFPIVEWMKKLNLTKAGKWLITVTKYACLGLVFRYIAVGIPTKWGYAMLVPISLSLILIFCGQGIEANWCAGKITAFLGKFSLPMYLCHTAYRSYIADLFPTVTDKNKQMAVFLVLALGSALLVMLVSDLLRKNAGRITESMRSILISKDA